MPKTLLLADDSVTIQKVVGITFANEDVELVTVDNGDDALIRARLMKPDLVLADIGMPGLDGYALCGAIRKDPNIGHTPVLLLTGTFETYDEDKAREVGANGYISKPFEAQALVDRVFAMLAQAAARPAAPVAPPAAPRPVATPAPQPVAAPAPPAPPAPQVRPRPELPPIPGVAAPKPARPNAPTPRPVEPFEFDVTPPPSPAPPRMQAAAPAAPPPADEPLWEAEPELESPDDSPVLRATLESELPDFAAPAAPAAPADSTRFFAPDLLGRPARLPDVPEPPPAPRPARANFSFEDLDFEEPTGSPANQTQIFGESSDSFGESKGDEAESPLADPLYSQTKFLDPMTASRQPGPKFDTPNPAAAPPLPDLLASEEITEPNHAMEELELSEADAEPEPIDAQPFDEGDPFAAPFSPETAAALAAPEFAPVGRTAFARDNAATRLVMKPEAPLALEDAAELEPELVDAEPMSVEPPPELELEPPRAQPAWREPDPRPTAPVVSRMPVPEAIRAAAPMIDPAVLSQTLEKVAWEAFGSLSEQVVSEVRKRVEAVVWEVVPQLCERLIREEIARLKSELPE
jgi:CheY-like chemotaxis protein